MWGGEGGPFWRKGLLPLPTPLPFLPKDFRKWGERSVGRPSSLTRKTVSRQRRPQKLEGRQKNDAHNRLFSPLKNFSDPVFPSIPRFYSRETIDAQYRPRLLNAQAQRRAFRSRGRTEGVRGESFPPAGPRGGPLAAGGIPRRHPRYFTASMIPAQTASTSSRLRPGCKGSVNSSPCNCSVAGRDGLPPPYSDNKWFGL